MSDLAVSTSVFKQAQSYFLKAKGGTPRVIPPDSIPAPATYIVNNADIILKDSNHAEGLAKIK
jgi:hypothetical protein